jgi:hypothetical protein
MSHGEFRVLIGGFAAYSTAAHVSVGAADRAAAEMFAPATVISVCGAASVLVALCLFRQIRPAASRVPAEEV